MSQKLSLEWNDFQENLQTSVKSLLGNGDFADVTLACEDGQQFEVHQVILAASSTFFKNMLKTNKHKKPMIYMRAVQSENLKAIIDFLYSGETQIPEEKLDSFLSIAEELKVQGLVGTFNNRREEKERESEVLLESKEQNKFPSCHVKPELDVEQLNTNVGPSYDTLEKLEKKLKTFMVKSENLLRNKSRRASICKLCGKEGRFTNIRDHIETSHLENMQIPCTNCGKTFTSTSAMKLHNRRSHTKNI